VMAESPLAFDAAAMLRKASRPGSENAAPQSARMSFVAMRRLFAAEFQAQHPDLMRDRREAFLRTDPDVLRAACAALAELDLRPELAKVRVPVLVLVGEHDEATPPPMSHELAAGLPDARLKIIAGCAHVPQLQSPEAFLDAIGDFLPALHGAPRQPAA
jgi:3-oxoadipate enol-lactonase